MMKILGDTPFTRTAEGALKSRIGTLFLRTPGLVTLPGVHAAQRVLWIAELNRLRTEKGEPPLSEGAQNEECTESVDLIFTEDAILIRPDPARMDLAFRADEMLQEFASKRQIRFLNTHTAKVRHALRARGENWRMAREAASPEELNRRIESAHCAIQLAPIYYYNRRTGTRYLTASGFTSILALPPEKLRAQILEIQRGVGALNRLGQAEIDFFPVEEARELKQKIRAFDIAGDDDALKSAVETWAREYRAVVPAALRDERTDNFEWRNAIIEVLSRRPNETEANEAELIRDISPEFYNQIEWLPGGRVEDGKFIFDNLYEEAQRTQEPALLEFCDYRVRCIIFNLMRLFGDVEYVNIGRIAHSLVRHPQTGIRRGGVYMIQYKERGDQSARLYMIRFQKWGIAEHLDEGKDLLQANIEANEYADYILDRRLACRQLGMNLPRHVGSGQFSERYSGHNQYNGTTIRTNYFVRAYIPGTASDKVPPARFANPLFARRFAELMGAAAAIDLIVGRAQTETGENVFDTNYEVLQCDKAGIPQVLAVTDHAGSFVHYQEPLETLTNAYARVVTRRLQFVSDKAGFKAAFVNAFRTQLAATQGAYAAHREAFDELFTHRPFDTAGSCAYRWHCVLKRLKACNPANLAAQLQQAIN